MSGNFIKPPTMGETKEVKVPAICEMLGIPSERVDRAFLQSYLLPATAVAFCDDEFYVIHEPYDDPELIESFGATSFNQGNFGTKLRELFEHSDPETQHQIDAFVRVAAAAFAKSVVKGDIALSPAPNVHLGAGGMLLFDQQQVALSRRPDVVIDYGPGVQGRFHIERQLTDAHTGQPIYAYIAIGKGPFINEFLQRYWSERLDDKELFNSVLGRLYIGREDGIAAATTEFIATGNQHMGSPAIADLVIASGIHRADHDEVAAGILNAYPLLKPGGSLLLRAPKASNPKMAGSVSAETMVNLALQAGFSEQKAVFFDTVTGNQLGDSFDSLSVVFHK